MSFFDWHFSEYMNFKSILGLCVNIENSVVDQSEKIQRSKVKNMPQEIRSKDNNLMGRSKFGSFYFLAKLPMA